MPDNVKFYYNSIPGASGSLITATSAESANPIENIYSMLEVRKWKGSTAADPHNINIDLQHGKLTNGDFEIGTTSGWSLSVQGGASATLSAEAVTPYQGTYRGMVAITNGGTAETDIQLYQTNKSITKGKKQHIIFAVGSTEAARTIKLDLIKTNTPWSSYTEEGPQTINLTTSWQVKTYTFTANITANDARLQILLGGSAYDVALDILAWYEEPVIPTADYLAILGHNLATIGANVQLLYSDDGSNYTGAFAVEKVMSDKVFLKEFTQTVMHRYWRLAITGHNAAPYMAICIWGNKTELYGIETGVDPHGQEAQDDVFKSFGGYVTGVHTRHIERQMALTFKNAPPALYMKVKTWWETSGRKNFFVAWERGGNPGDVYLMQPDRRFHNPLSGGGLYRDISISLTGRME